MLKNSNICKIIVMLIFNTLKSILTDTTEGIQMINTSGSTVTGITKTLVHLNLTVITWKHEGFILLGTCHWWVNSCEKQQQNEITEISYIQLLPMIQKMPSGISQQCKAKTWWEMCRFIYRSTQVFASCHILRAINFWVFLKHHGSVSWFLTPYIRVFSSIIYFCLFIIYAFLWRFPWEI